MIELVSLVGALVVLVATLVILTRRGPRSVQDAFLGIEAIRDDCLHLVGGELRAVLEVGSVNFALLGPAEQRATIGAYAQLLNGLTMPIQIVIRIVRVELEPYLEDVAARAAQERSPALAALARDKIAFLRALAAENVLLERRFYVVVPAGDGAALARAGGWSLALPALTDRRRAAWHPPTAPAQRTRLNAHCAELKQQLRRCGLEARRLDTSELAQLLSACWCPDLANRRRLRRVQDYASLYVRGAHTTASWAGPPAQPEEAPTQGNGAVETNGPVPLPSPVRPPTLPLGSTGQPLTGTDELGARRPPRRVVRPSAHPERRG